MTHTESSRQQKFHTHKQKDCKQGEKLKRGLTQDVDQEGIVVAGGQSTIYANEVAKRRKNIYFSSKIKKKI
jgi:hypothetical protein